MKTKALITVIVAMALFTGTMAQNIHHGEFYELNDSLKSEDNYEYNANNYIDLNPGFHSEPTGGYSTVLQLESDGYGIFPPEEGFVDGDGNVVGSLGGVVNVGAMGGLRYTIPIELPQGIHGMQPNLAITYNSQAGNGTMGWGWELEGLSCITRTGQTLYHDGNITTADLSWNDRFLLDGKRLITVADYTDSIEFRLEQDEMSKIMAYVSYKHIGGLIGYGTVKVLDRFVVWKADGLIMEYRAANDYGINLPTNSFHALYWQLHKISDRNGNAVLYHYYKDSPHNEFYIDTIEYTTNAIQGLPAQFVISFEYDGNRRDYEKYYIGGESIQMTHLLRKIKVSKKTNHKPLSEYEFNYVYDNNRLYNILDNVNLKVFDDEGATTFVWGSNTICQQLYYSTINTNIFDKFPFTGDFNGDGYTDVAMVPYKEDAVYDTLSNLRVYLNDRNHGFDHMPSMDLPIINEALDWIHVLDINGDGLDDLVPCYYDTIIPSGQELTIISVYLNNPNTHSFDLGWIGVFPNHGDIIVGDFDGNGDSDILVLEKKTKTITIDPDLHWDEDVPFIQNAYYLGYSNSQIQSSKINTTSLESMGPVFNMATGDFTGDGTSEVLLVGLNHDGTPYHGSKICRCNINGSNNGFYIVQDFSEIHPNDSYPYHYIGGEDPWCHVFTGDFNGDGKTDLLYYLLCYWYVCFSDGNAIGQPIQMTNNGHALPSLNCHVNLFYPSLRLVKNISNSYMATCIVNDFDGDGISDLCFMRESTRELHFASRITTTPSIGTYFRKAFIASSNTYFRTQFIHVGNFLGSDNVSFLCSLQPDKDDRNGIATIQSLYSVGQYNSIQTVSDGLNNKTSFTYDYLTPKASGTTDPFYSYNYSVPDSYGVRPVPFATRALKTYSVEGVNNSKLITKYHYQNAMFHKNGHGFMGFGSTTVETYRNSLDSLWSTKKVSVYEKTTMGEHAMLLPYRETSYVNSNGEARAVNRTQYDFEKVRFANGQTNLVVCPAMINKSEELYSMDEDDVWIATNRTTYQYNYNGNQTYSNAYGCTSVTQTITERNNRNAVYSLETTKETELQTLPSSWVVNRLVSETVTRSRNDETTSSKTLYTYLSNNSYQPQTVTFVPDGENQANDPLALSTQYGYDAFGNITSTTISAPNGTHHEEPRTVAYEYGSDYQHRLITKETRGAANDGYVTDYSYDFHDRPQSVTDLNGMRTEFASTILGTEQSVFYSDSTEQRSLTLWADQSPYKPEGATYYTWSKKTGAVTTMTFFHKSGAALRDVTFDFQGYPIYVDRKYNAKGLLERESVPYRRGEDAANIQWTSYHYDRHDRVDRINYPDGSAKTIAYDGLVTTTTIIPSQDSPSATPQTTVSKTNALGWLRESIDADGTSVSYEYDPDGNLMWTCIGNDETTKISMEYDHAGNRTLLHDPDYCTVQKDLISEYNAFGEEVSRTTPNGFVTTFAYDKFGRLTERSEEEEVEPGVTDIRNTLWSYGEVVPQKGLLMTVTYPGQTISYKYDTCQRLASESVWLPAGESHYTKYTYDRASRIASVKHPSGMVVNYHYNTRGYQCAQTDTIGNLLYRTERTTPMGQVERFSLGGVLLNKLDYDSEKHLLTRILTQKNNDTIQNFSYNYDGFCNLASRKDNMRNLEETFEYDSQNRLKKVRLGPTLTGASVYDSYGRMTAKTANGQLIFYDAEFGTTAKPHAMDAATTVAENFPQATQTITYTGFDKVSKVKQGNDSLCYTYGYDHQRILMEEHVGNRHRTKRYVGNCEYITKTNGNVTDTQWLTYLTGPTGVYAVVATENGREKIHYIMKDNLGSWTTVADEEGSVEQQLSYDAWGNLRNPNSWSGNYTGAPMFDRGFTGHEHLTAFGLINMNGRMYDPMMSSFLSVDQYVQSPGNAQGFNQYAYCMNNPLKYVDPSGWRYVGGIVGYTPNSADYARDPYAYADSRGWEPRELGIREISTSDPVVTWMEENELHGGGGGGSIETKGGWYKSGDEIRWNPSISSQDDLDNLGISGKYLGHSYIDKSKQMYYSLLGYMIDMNQGGGIAGRIAPLIDEAFINYEEFRKELVSLNKTYGDEQQQKWTDFINVIEYDYNRGGLQEYCFFLGPIECHFFVGKTENSMKARIEHVDLTKTRPDSNNGYGIVKWSSGYDINFVSKASYYDSNPRNSRTVVLIIPQSHWNSFKTRYNSVFPFKP